MRTRRIPLRAVLTTVPGRVGTGCILTVPVILCWSVAVYWTGYDADPGWARSVLKFAEMAALTPGFLAFWFATRHREVLEGHPRSRPEPGWARTGASVCFSLCALLWISSWVWLLLVWERSGTGPYRLAVAALCLCLTGAALHRHASTKGARPM
ncbi:hypothetical protein [Streptomyces sp. YKOK-I1]